MGTSYGGYVVMLLTAHRPVHWLAMRVPALYPDDHQDTPKAKLDEAAVRAYREQAREAGANRALFACADFLGDVLIGQSEKDEQILRQAIISMQGAFQEANSLSHRIIPGATHAMRDAQHQRVYATLLTGWIEKMVRASRLTYR